LHVRYHAPNAMHAQEPMHVQAQIDTCRYSPAFVHGWTERKSMPIYNGMPASEVPVSRWHKSRRSNPSGNCVELARLSDGSGVALRNSRDPDGPALIYTRAEIEAFLRGAADGDFDHLLQD
jgi:Domain of unknown function (DUF397)